MTINETKPKLTELTIKHLKYEGKQKTYFDSHLPSFGVRVSPNTKSFIVMYGQRRQMKTLGRYPDMTLKDARTAAMQFLGTVNSTPSLETTPFIEAYPDFISDASKRLKPETVRQYEQYLKILGFQKNVGEITKADIDKRLSIYDGKPWAQNYAYATLRSFFNWCLDNELLEKHPLMRGRAPNTTKSRERVLTDDEMARVWRATTDNTYGRMVRVLILTGQRRMEVRNLKPEDIADGLITFHTKGDKINILPLTPLVEENLVLPFNFNNWSDSLARLASESRVDMRHHDLRRTLATKLAQLGVHDIVIERVLGHTVESVKYTYNRYSYLEEVKDALLRYEAHIRRIASPAC